MISNEEFISIVEKCQTMALAAKKVGMAYTSFIRKAKKLGCYKPNQGHKGVKTGHPSNWIQTEDILALLSLIHI